MKTSTEIGSIAKIVGEEKAVEYVAKAGFSAWDFSMFNMGQIDWSKNEIIYTGHPLQTDNYAEFAKKLRKIGEDNGIHCNQSHAPFPVRVKAIMDLQKRAIECTAIAGGEICVIHPDNNKTAEQNTEMYLSLLPFAKEHNVKIATENMWNWDDKNDCAVICACSDKKNFTEQMELIKDDYFVACLDIGHAEMFGDKTSAYELICALNTRLKALHIHDNDRRHDSHQLPFTMNIDFNKVVKGLKEIGYNGYLTLEADTFLRTHGYDKDNAFDGVKKMHEHLAMVDNMMV